MKYILALVGESGCGKDTIKDHILAKHPEIKPIVRLTNRPMRENEEQYKPYAFVTLHALQKMALMETEKFMEVEEIKDNDWFYATHKELSFKFESPSDIYIGCYSAESIDNLHQACVIMSDEFKLIPIKIEVEDKVRLNRQLMREDNPDCYEICRRYLSDVKEYANGLDFPYYEVDNNGDLNQTLEAISVIIESETVEDTSPDLDEILAQHKNLDND